MLLFLWDPDGGEGDRHLGGVAGVQDEVGVRIDQVPAGRAGQQGMRYDAIVAGPEGMAGVELLHQLAVAAGATELAVQCIESTCLRRNDVVVPFNRLPGELGI